MPGKYGRRLALQRYQKQRRRNLLAQPGAHRFAIVLDRLKAGYNVAKIFRSAQAFGAGEVHLIGIGPFDPSPGKGAFKAVPARFHDDFKSCHRDLRQRGYRLYALEPDCSQTLYDAELPERSAFIFGHEELGIAVDRVRYPDIGCLGIPSYGPMQSLNVSVAASIVMYEYVRRYGGR